MPWEISAALAAAALFALAVVAAMTLVEMRRTSRKSAELSATLERHLPAVLQNLEEIKRNAEALKSSIQTVSDRTIETGIGFERIASGLHGIAQSLEANLIEPVLKTAKGVSAILAFSVALRRLRHSLRLLLWRGKGPA
jgi:alanyl-tRNA synthetase